VDHVGSADDADELALLEETARRRLYAGQQVLDLDVPGQGRTDPGSAVVEATSSRILWGALSDLYAALGFAAVRDEAFRALVLGRIVEPTNKSMNGAKVFSRETVVGENGKPEHSLLPWSIAALGEMAVVT
jgi:hypothetical protein